MHLWFEFFEIHTSIDSVLVTLVWKYIRDGLRNLIGDVLRVHTNYQDEYQSNKHNNCRW